MKKLLCMVTLICMFSLVLGSTALAFEGEDFFADQGPLTQKDIDDYLMLGPDALSAVENNDIAKLSRILEPTGIDQMHAYYFYTKISCGYVMLVAPDMADSLIESLPPSGVPNATELKLIEKNKGPIEKLITRQ